MGREALARGDDPTGTHDYLMQLMSAYIEVQYHGDLKVGRDVVMVVLCESDLDLARRRHGGLVERFRAQYNVPVYTITGKGRLLPL